MEFGQIGHSLVTMQWNMTKLGKLTKIFMWSFWWWETMSKLGTSPFMNFGTGNCKVEAWLWSQCLADFKTYCAKTDNKEIMIHYLHGFGLCILLCFTITKRNQPSIDSSFVWVSFVKVMFFTTREHVFGFKDISCWNEPWIDISEGYIMLVNEPWIDISGLD